MEWAKEHWLLVLPMVLGSISVAGLMPQGAPRGAWMARLLGLASLGMVGGMILQPTGETLTDVLFYLFAGAAIVAAVLMITNRNPAYSALWFALVTLAVCGLFLLQSAPFLASATVIVYAGAIIVTFLFVLMLAQQAGATNCDQNSRQPGSAVCLGFVLLGALLFVIVPPKEGAAGSSKTGFVSLVEPTKSMAFVVGSSVPQQKAIPPQSTSVPTAGTFGSMRGLGRSLFGDYLFAVELAGTLLLIASIGAIVIAPKRSSGKL